MSKYWSKTKTEYLRMEVDTLEVIAKEAAELMERSKILWAKISAVREQIKNLISED